MKTRYVALTQLDNDKRAAMLFVLVAGLMLAQIIALGAIAVARAHEGSWLRAAAASLPAVLAIGASVKGLVCSTSNADDTANMAGIGMVAWLAGAAVQVVAIVAAPVASQWLSHF